MRNSLLGKLQNREQPVGTFFSAGNAAMAEILAMTGLDYIIIDTEHGPFDVESSADIMRAAERHGMPTLVRVKDSSRPSILKMLDIGADGLVIPQVHTVEEVEKIVEYGKYSPLGRRGFAIPRAAGYGFSPICANPNDFLTASNEQTLLLPQCETAGCLEHIEKIAAIDGVAGIFVGPFDLSTALGIPSQFDNPAFTAAIERILAACTAAGKFCFTFAVNVPGVHRAFAQKFDSVALSTECGIFGQAWQRLLAEIRQ